MKEVMNQLDSLAFKKKKKDKRGNRHRWIFQIKNYKLKRWIDIHRTFVLTKMLIHTMFRISVLFDLLNLDDVD